MKVRFAVLAATAILMLCAGSALAAPCAPGTSSPTGSDPCTPCPAGKYSDTFGATTCTNCQGGFSSPPGAQACFPCDPGTFSLAGGLCTTCPDGTISATSGSTFCLICPAGKTSNETHTACINVAPAAGPWAKVAVALLIAGTGLLFVRRRQTA